MESRNLAQNDTSISDPENAKIEVTMEEAVDKFLQERQQKDEPPQKTEDPAEPAETKGATREEPEDPPETKGEGTDKGEGADKGDSGPDDDTIERAVRLGFSMKEAREIGSTEALKAVCDKLERANAAKSAETKPNDGKDDKPEDEVEIPDLDPEEWDEAIVKGWSTMKSAIKQLREENKALRSAGESAQKDASFNRRLEGLGDGYRDAFGVGSEKPTSEQIATREKVRQKFDILNAGYKAAGIEAKPDEVFSEAVRMVVGDKPAEQDRRQRLEERKALAINRPAHERTSAGKTGKNDIDSIKADVARELAGMYK